MEAIFQESIHLIDNFPKLLTNLIPDHILEAWIYNGYIEENPPQELLFAAAIYKYARDKYGDSTLSPERDRHQFETMQYILASEYVCRRVSCKLRSKQIFNFARYNEPLNVDLKRKQVYAFNKLAATLVPLVRAGVGRMS